jgi:hypothetical protein
MKVLCRDSSGKANFLFDTNSSTIRLENAPIGYRLIGAGYDIYEGEKSNVLELFEAIINAEKFGKNFFEIKI